MTYLFLFLGFILLIKGADYFVDGSSNIAAYLRVPPLLVGLTIVAFGTSSPEATVSILAAVEGSTHVAVGNAVGSNIFNITLVVGITAILSPLTVERDTIRKEIPFTLLASAALFILMSDIAFQFGSENLITRGDGYILLLFLAIFIYYIFEVARNSKDQAEEQSSVRMNKSLGKNILFTVGGLAAIILGGELVVDNSTNLAYQFGMSETMVGLTIGAMGTSLPELITSVTAAVKKLGDIALGNIVGSNILNILFVLGTSSVIAPLQVDDKIFLDVFFMIILTVLLLIFSRTHSKVGRMEGSILAFAYVAYLVFVILRN